MASLVWQLECHPLSRAQATSGLVARMKDRDLKMIYDMTFH